MLTVIKVFSILFLLCLWKQGTPWQFSKQISKLSFQLSFQIYSLLAQTEGEKGLFWKGARKGTTSRDYPQQHLVDIRDEKVSPSLVKFEIILPLLCFLLDLRAQFYVLISSKKFIAVLISTRSSMNLWIDSRNCQK